MHVKVASSGVTGFIPLPGFRCPSCREMGTLERAEATIADIEIGNYPEKGKWMRAGMRRCPNPKCHALIFVIISMTNELLTTYPAERIDFDSTNVPKVVLEAMGEALTCHANECYIAAAIMVRKTIELLCHERGATGKQIWDRIDSLGRLIILPDGYIEAMHNLRMLGNDAAHVECKDFDQVEREEVEVGIAVAKDIIRAVYQQSSTIDRLNALKKNAGT